VLLGHGEFLGECLIPAICHGIADPKVALDALKTLMG
jgi:hypothetical protein